jgi:transposase-like protein
MEGTKMLNKTFQELLIQLDKLTFTQSKQALNHLSHKCSIETLENITPDVESCPHCQSHSIHKWGVRSNIQRYRCKECHKSFNALTKTPLARLRHKESWLNYAKDLIDGESIRESAKHCHVDKSTTFRWRHKMLQIPIALKAQHLHGVVEFDETYFLESHKGERHLERKPRTRGGKATKRGISSEQIAVLIVRDRNGNTTDAILEQSNQNSIGEVLLPVLDKDALLCSDSKPSYKAFAQNAHFTLETINVSAKEHVRDGVFHVQNVNAYDSRLKEWMKHFHGVATKYLNSYLGWMRLLDREKSITAKELLGVISGRKMMLQPLMRT